MLLLVLAVSPITAPFVLYDLGSALNGTAPHQGASLKVKAPDQQQIATAAGFVPLAGIGAGWQADVRPPAAPAIAPLALDPPLRL